STESTSLSIAVGPRGAVAVVTSQPSGSAVNATSRMATVCRSSVLGLRRPSRNMPSLACRGGLLHRSQRVVLLGGEKPARAGLGENLAIGVDGFPSDERAHDLRTHPPPFERRPGILRKLLGVSIDLPLGVDV